MKVNRINKTPPTVPFEKKNKFPKGYMLVDMGFPDKYGNYKEDWQLVRIDELKGK